MAATQRPKEEWFDPAEKQYTSGVGRRESLEDGPSFQAQDFGLAHSSRQWGSQVPAFVKAGTSNDPDRVYRERVLCRVYHLQQSRIAQGLNRMTQSGLYHTGVEVYGREWWYGATFDEWSTGITWNPPKMNKDHTYKETLLLGYTSMSPMQVWQAIEEMRWEWRGCNYHLLSRNCHHFSDAFCQKLGVNRPPYWINHLGNMGEGLTDILSTDDLADDGREPKQGPVSSLVSSVTSGIYSIFGGSSEPDPLVKLAHASPQTQQPDKGNRRTVEETSI